MATQRVDLPSGGWVQLKDPTTVKERARRPVSAARARLTYLAPEFIKDAQATREWNQAHPDDDQRKVDATLLTPDGADAAADFDDALVRCLADTWHVGDVDGSDGEVLLDELSGPDYDHLLTVCRDCLGDLFLDTSVKDPSDRSTPSTPSAA